MCCVVFVCYSGKHLFGMGDDGKFLVVSICSRYINVIADAVAIHSTSLVPVGVHVVDVFGAV